MKKIIIIGGGIVGLATAYSILEMEDIRSFELVVIEKEAQIATHQTGNNSGVIHSGVYYTPGSYKAKNCIDGYQRLLDFSNQNDIPYELCGKVIVASNESEINSLEKIFSNGQANGLENLQWAKSEEIKEVEPYVDCVAGIKVPQAGIIDYKKVAEKLAEIIEKKGGHILLNSKVINVEKTETKIVVATKDTEIEADIIINCAGLYSDKIARLTNPNLDYKIIPFRGEYYKLKSDKNYLVNSLIYPVPDLRFPFLGVHFTKRIDGSVDAGPNAVLAFRREGYTFWDIQVEELIESLAYPGFRKIIAKYWRESIGEIKNSLSKTAYTNALKKLIPSIVEEDLVKGGAGVRAQLLDKKGTLINDFMIDVGKNYINVINAPSPAATSCLSIGYQVTQELQKIIK